MQTCHFILGMTSLLLTGVASAAQARTFHVHWKGAGAFADGVETNIDTDGDGVSAIVDQGVQNGTIGKFLFQEEEEWIHQKTVTTCPIGTTDEYHIDSTRGQGRIILTDEKTGDQLFIKRLSGTLCFNFSSSPFSGTGSAHDEYIGGTGQYAGATGPQEGSFAVSYLQVGFKGGPGGPFGGFGQFTFTSNSVLNLPNARDSKED